MATHLCFGGSTGMADLENPR